jgi:hypothetical protein
MLPPEQKPTYRQIVEDLCDYNHIVDLRHLSCRKELQNVISYVELDHPEMFYVDFRHFRYTSNKLEFDFLYDRPTIAKYEYELNKRVGDIRKHIGSIKIRDDFSLFGSLHNFFVKRDSYAYDALQDSSKTDGHNIVGAILQGTAVCGGISKAYKFLCIQFNLVCFCIIGESLRTPKGLHEWNIVHIGDAYYHVDVTWDMTSSENAGGITRYDYFALSDYEIRHDHRFKDIGLNCQTMANNYFQRNGTLLSGKKQLAEYVTKTLAAGEKVLYFKLRRHKAMPVDINGIVKKTVTDVLIKNLSGPVPLRYSTNNEQLIYCYEIL